MDEKKYKCPKCGKNMLFEDTVCPFCGHVLQKRKWKKLLIWALALVLILPSVVNLYREASLLLPEPAEEEAEDSPWQGALDGLTPHPAEETDSRESEYTRALIEALLENCPSSRQNLVNFLCDNDYSLPEAEESVDLMEIDFAEQAFLYTRMLLYEVGGYSEQDLIELLQYEEFLPEEIRSAMSRIDPDYREQAQLCADYYLDSMPFSLQELTDQLEYHGFSQEDARYAVENCGADWQENAIAAARECRDSNPLWSVERIGEHLRFHDFTEEEITAALEALD